MAININSILNLKHLLYERCHVLTIVYFGFQTSTCYVFQ